MVSTNIFSAKSITACTGNSCCRYFSCPRLAPAPYWPMLFLGKDERLPGIVETITIDKLEVVICPCISGVTLFKGTPNTDLLAIRLDFR